jgi:hypothetical protein
MTTRRGLAMALPILFTLNEAHAMRPPEEYRAARAAATHWIQLRLAEVQKPDKKFGVCIVRGEITRCFRGAALAHAVIDLGVECKPRFEASPPGEEFLLDAEDLRVGLYLEAFANLEAGRWMVAARQVEFIAEPAPTPSFTGKE